MTVVSALPTIDRDPFPGRGIVAIVLIAIAAAILVAVATRHGPGISPDSIVYLASARSLARGYGLLAPGGADFRPAPMTHFPPFYPLMLSLGRSLMLRPLAWARLLNISFMTLNVIAIALLAHRAAAGVWPAIIAAAIAATSVDFLNNHIYLYSEPPTLLMMSAAILFLDAHLRRASTRNLLFASLLTAAACLTRYSAVAFVGAGTVGLLVLSRARTAKRFRDAAIFAAPAALSLLVWMLHNRHVAHTLASRPIVWHFGSVEQFKSLASTTYSAIAAPQLGSLRPAIAAALLVFLLAAIIRNRIIALRSEREPVQRIMTLLALTMAAHFTLSLVVLEPNMPLDSRLMAPAFVTGLVMLVAGIARRIDGWDAMKPIATALIILLIAVNFGSAVAAAHALADSGAGYAGARWTKSTVLKSVLALPRDTLIISNAADVVQFRDSLKRGWSYADEHGRRVLLTPESVEDLGQIETLRQALRHGAVLVFARGVRPYTLNEAQLRSVLPIEREAHDEFGFSSYVYRKSRDHRG